MSNKNLPDYDFSGWATKANLTCSDGRIIMPDAFKHNDNCVVPLVWNHLHNDPDNVLGKCVLENREDGVYAYGKFNDTERGNVAKNLVCHGDVTALSICANRLKQTGACVTHGNIYEVSLVLAGANPGACIDSVIRHGEESEDEAVIYTGEPIEIAHANKDNEPTKETKEEPDKKEDKPMATDNNEKTVQDVWDTLNEEQKTVVYALIGQALDEQGEEGGKDVKHNIFEGDYEEDTFLSHADETQILTMAKSNSVGSLQDAIGIFTENNGGLAHGIEDIEQLFPDYKDVRPGAPELLTDDQSWVSDVINKCEKSPISRIRTRFADARNTATRALGFKKGKEKKNMGNIKLLKRTTDPQTIYIKDAMNRDDILDIDDFDVVSYMYNIMRGNLNTEIALAILVGDGREEGDDDKISETHVRSIWHDDDLYTIHQDVDVAAAKKELQGTNTSANFGNNYIYAEAIITAALTARKQYKGSGNLDFLCTPDMLNVMLLARDLNGRRIYDGVSDLKSALNVRDIHTVEQFEGKTRKDANGKTKKLLGIFVNLKDYRIGAVKGGQITRFNQFDIDFNQEKYLIETRVSGALTKVYSAIALEEPVDTAPAPDDETEGV